MSQTQETQYFGRDLEAMSFAENYHKWVIAEFDQYIRGLTAEIGAGIGNVSELILGTHLDQLIAFEPSHNMFPHLENKLKNHKNASAINGFFGHEQKIDTKFDTVIYINVLEHIEFDIEELQRCHEMIQADGALLIFVPALPRLYSQLDKDVGHFRRYTKKSLSQVVTQAGFRIEKLHYFDVAGILPWYINFTLLGNSMEGGSVSLYDRIVVPPMRILESLIHPPIGKNLLLVAKPE